MTIVILSLLFHMLVNPIPLFPEKQPEFPYEFQLLAASASEISGQDQ